MTSLAESIREVLLGHRRNAEELDAEHQHFRKQVHDNRNVRTESVKVARDFDKASDRALAVAQSAVRLLEATNDETRSDGHDS